jgi:hypothetical protein
MPYYRIYGGIPREITTWENFAGKDYITVTVVTPSELPSLGAPGEGESYALCDGEPLAWDAETSTWKNFFTQLGIPMNTGPQGEQGPTGENGLNGTNGTDATVTGYRNSTLKTSVISADQSSIVTDGIAAFQLTTDGLAIGAAIFQNEIFPESIHFSVNDPAASYQFGWELTNDDKTLTVTVNKLESADIVTGALNQVSAPDATIVNLSVKGR